MLLEFTRLLSLIRIHAVHLVPLMLIDLMTLCVRRHSSLYHAAIFLPTEAGVGRDTLKHLKDS